MDGGRYNFDFLFISGIVFTRIGYIGSIIMFFIIYTSNLKFLIGLFYF